MYSQAMLPKQLESAFDLLESYDCEEIVLRRMGPIHSGGHLHAQYLLSVKHQGIDREWRDHSLTRLVATAITEVTNTSPWPDDVPFVVPEH
jgi:hypothetical protein